MGEIPRQATRAIKRQDQRDAEQQLLAPQKQQNQKAAANQNSAVVGQAGAGEIQQAKPAQAAQAKLPQPAAAQAPQQQGRNQQRQNGALGIGHAKPSQNADGNPPVGIVIGVNWMASGVGQGDYQQDQAQVHRQNSHCPVVQIPALAEKGDKGQGPQGELRQLQIFRGVPHRVLIAQPQGVEHVQRPKTRHHAVHSIIGPAVVRDGKAVQAHHRQQRCAKARGQPVGVRLAHKIGEHIQQGLDHQQRRHHLPTGKASRCFNEDCIIAKDSFVIMSSVRNPL